MIKWRNNKIFFIILPKLLCERIAACSNSNRRSFNEEVISTLEEKYSSHISIEAQLYALNKLLRSIEWEMGPDAFKSDVYQIICQIKDKLENQLS